MSEETRRKMAASMRGKTHSPETKAKMSARARGRKMSAEAVEKMAAAKRGARFSPDARRNMSLGKGGNGEPGYSAIHKRLALDYPKNSVCEECGKKGKTDYAFLRHPQPHTTAREDYRELCPSCHKRVDQSATAIAI